MAVFEGIPKENPPALFFFGGGGPTYAKTRPLVAGEIRELRRACCSALDLSSGNLFCADGVACCLGSPVLGYLGVPRFWGKLE